MRILIADDLGNVQYEIDAPDVAPCQVADAIAEPRKTLRGVTQ